MGCAVEMTDTGVEIDVHTFDTHADAVNYVMRSRGYGHTGYVNRHATDFYVGPVEGERASVRKTRNGDTWRACFWIEGDVRVVSAGSVQGKPAWHGEIRVGDKWIAVTNSNGDPISYASTKAALDGAKLTRAEVWNNTIRSA